MTLVLDSGAFIALERNDRAMWRRLKAAHLTGSIPIDAALVLLAADGDHIITR